MFKEHEPIQLAEKPLHKLREHSTTSKLLEVCCLVTLAKASSLSEAKEGLLIKGLLCSTPALVIMSAQKIRRNRKQHAERGSQACTGEKRVLTRLGTCGMAAALQQSSKSL